MAKTGFRPGSKWGQSGANIYSLNTGNVGIGTTGPGAKLEIATGATADAIKLSGNPSLTINSSGNGTNSSTTLDFNFTNITSSPGALRFFRSTNTSGRVSLDILKGDNSATINSSLSGNGSSYLNVNTGNVGIGNNNPQTKLHVTSAELRLQTDSAYISFFNTAGTRRGFVQATEGAFNIYSEHATNPLQIYQGATLRGSLNASALAMTVPVTTSAGGAAGAGTQTLSTTLYNQSRTENLVTNGSGLLRNNYNFSLMDFDATELHGGGGSFKVTINQVARLNDELIPIDPAKYYRLVGWAMAGDTGGANFDSNNKQYFGIATLDADGNNVQPYVYAKHTGSTDTTLAVDLNTNDTTMTLTDATGWSTSATGHTRNMLWWPYTNSFGYSYPAYTYSRNSTNIAFAGKDYNTNGLWATTGISGNVITLREPWPGPNLPAGTPVRNTVSGGTYKYIAAANVTVPNTWTRYEGFVGGVDVNGTAAQDLIPYGTAYIKILFLCNYPPSSGNTIRWSDIWFSEMSSRNLETATATVPGVVSTSAQTFAGDKTFNGKLGIGAAPASDRALNILGTTATGTNYGVVNQLTGAATTNISYYAAASGATTNIGLQIASPSTGANNYAINSSATAKSYFAGSMGLGTTSPTAILHLKAGTATASTAPFKFTSGTNLTTAEPGAMEYDGTNLFFTRSGTTREGVLTQSAVTTEAVTSDTTVTVNIGGVTYKLLAKA